MKDQREVSPLSRGVMWRVRNPYPPHYKTAFAFSLLLYPQHYRLVLRRAFPHGGATGLPCSASVPEWGRSALFAGSVVATTGGCVAHRPCCIPFGPSLSAPLACWMITTFIRR